MAKVGVGPHPSEQKTRPACCDAAGGCWRWHYWWDRTSVSRAVEAWNSDFVLACIWWGMATFGEGWWGAVSRREWPGGTGVSLTLLAKQPGASFKLKCWRVQGDDVWAQIPSLAESSSVRVSWLGCPACCCALLSVVVRSKFCLWSLCSMLGAGLIALSHPVGVGERD